MEDSYRNNIVDFALIQIDKKFTWGMKGPDEFDCPGFTSYVFFELFGIKLEKNGYGSNDIAKQMTNSIGTLRQYAELDTNKRKYLDEIKAGDLVFFNKNKKGFNDNNSTVFMQFPLYVGVFIGDNKFIYASEDEGRVMITEIDDNWLKSLIASRDIVSHFILKANL